MENKKTSIVAFHDPMGNENTSRLLKSYGFENKSVYSMEQMREVMNSNEPFDVYLMDVNLDHSNSTNIDSGLEVYCKIKDRLEKGQAKFFVISGNSQALEKAVQEGIPKECTFSKGNTKIYKILGDMME